MTFRRLLMGCSLALLAVGPAFAADEASDPKAEKLMHDAHVARSSWDASFPGFSAKISVALDGEETQGTLTVAPDGKCEIDLPKSELSSWAKSQLRSIVGHRQAGVRPDYNVAFVEKQGPHPLGKLIKFLESKSHSVYRIQGDVITEVHRNMGQSRFTISVTEVARNKEGKYLPKSFSVSYWDGKTGDLVRSEDYQEDWIRVGKYDLPSRRLLIKTSKDERSVGELRLSDHSLLPASSSAN